MPQKIYIVSGTSGEYSDHREWMVKAFTDEGRAKSLVLSATQAASEALILRSRDEDCDLYGVIYTNPFDPYMSMDYTGVRYYIDEVELET